MLPCSMGGGTPVCILRVEMVILDAFKRWLLLPLCLLSHLPMPRHTLRSGRRCFPVPFPHSNVLSL